MFRRIVFSNLKTLISSSSSAISKPSSFLLSPRIATATAAATATAFIPRLFSSDSSVSKPTSKVEDVMPIATGHEREELEAELEGRDILEINHPEGPFGTKEEPAIVRSYYDRRIVGCPGGEGEDEHDVVWFWLEKDKPHECPVCTQYFKLEVVGPGGDPEGHDHDEDEHHH
ncbi:cytochrome c oxidase subunit 5b-1, mitochondrial-like [Silene latifolia]|uniref:cytochrome c oxidase subunit 5b-1, mitochondrial-like n=1 Tax=Silene latifolia TaxID=37657 RepID=UPI003D76EA6F